MHSKSIRIAMTLATLASLAGCVGVAGMLGASVNAYDGPTRPDTEVATLIRTKNAIPGRAFVKAIDDVNYGDDFLRGWPTVVKAVPGLHKITVKCFVANKYAFPSTHADLRAGGRYEVGCRDLGNGYAAATVAMLDAQAN